MAEESLGAYLKSARKAAGYTLRRVEELSNGTVKNGYLSQVEGGSIRVPSTKVLHELAGIYGVDYNTILRVADLPTVGAATRKRKEGVIAALPASATDDLTDAETKELLDFVAFIKSKRSR